MKKLLAIIAALIPYGCMPSPVSAVEFTPYGCEVYSRWTGEVGKARDAGRHPSQMEQVIEFNTPSNATPTQLAAAEFLHREIGRIYSRPQGSQELSLAYQECVAKDGNTDRMWLSQ